MNWQIVLEIVATAIASVGGAGAIIWALSSFFGKMWANKILEKQKAEYQKDIEQYKSELSLELEKVKATNEKLTYISKVQYDIEISVIKELTRASFNLVVLGCSVAPMEKSLLQDKNIVIAKHEKFYNDYKNSYNCFLDILGESIAFVDDDIYEEYNNFINLCKKRFDFYDGVYDDKLGIPVNEINKLIIKGKDIDTSFIKVNNLVKEHLKNIKIM